MAVAVRFAKNKQCRSNKRGRRSDHKWDAAGVECRDVKRRQEADYGHVVFVVRRPKILQQTTMLLARLQIDIDPTDHVRKRPQDNGARQEYGEQHGLCRSSDDDGDAQDFTSLI